MDKPIIRPVEAFPMEQQGQTQICLRDPTGLAPEPVMLGMGAYFLVTLFDGTNSTLDLQAAFSHRFGEIVPSEKIRELVAALDRAYFLESPGFAARLRSVREEFRESPARAGALAGLCYETEPSRLRAEIESFFERPNAPGRAALAAAPSSAEGRLAGLIAPHIDPRRGAAAYAWAYGELRRHERPELIVILGTSHYGAGPELFSATRKNYLTPLGAVPTDLGFVERLAARYASAHGGDLFADELLHRNEHSIEFQALFVAWALGVEGYQVVPILVSSFNQMVRQMVHDDETPADNPRVAHFLDALREELAVERRRVLILAGVDFAHVGRKFGDSFGVDDRVTERVRREDLALIETIKAGDPRGFFADIAREGDQRKICGLAPMYTQLALLSGRSARLLHYDIALEPQTDSLVSFASLAID